MSLDDKYVNILNIYVVVTISCLELESHTSKEKRIDTYYYNNDTVII